MSQRLSRNQELRKNLKDEYCDLERLENDCASDPSYTEVLPYITEAKKNFALALQYLGEKIPDCKKNG